jgi:stage V sporulation protein B
MNETKKFVFDVGVTFLATMIITIIGFVLSIFLARYLGPGDLGVYREALTFNSIATLICAIGIPPAMIKYLAEYKDDKFKIDQYTSSSIMTCIILGIIFIFLFYFSSGLIAYIFKMPKLEILIKILVFSFPFTLLNNVLLSFLNGLRKMKLYGIGIIVQNIAMTIITVFFVYNGWGSTGAVIGILVSSIILSIFLITCCRNYFEFTFKLYKETTRILLNYGARILSTSALNEINNQMDIILVGILLISSSVGFYSVAVGLSNFFWIIPLSIQKITYPATSEYWGKNNKTAINTMMDKTMKYSTVILVFLGLLVGFFATDIINILYKSNYLYAVIPLQILLIGTVIRGSIAQPISGALISIGKANLTFKITALMMSINVILDIILIPHFDIMGAAISSMISLSGGAFLNLFFTVKHLSIKVDVNWFLKMMGVVIFALILFKAGTLFLSTVIIGSIILTLYLIGIFKIFITEEDVYIFKSLINSAIYRR